MSTCLCLFRGFVCAADEDGNLIRFKELDEETFQKALATLMNGVRQNYRATKIYTVQCTYLSVTINPQIFTQIFTVMYGVVFISLTHEN